MSFVFILLARLVENGVLLLFSVNSFENKTLTGKSNKSITQSITSPEPSFKGLHHELTKRIYASPEAIQKMVGVYTREKGQVGNLPKEMIETIRKNIKNPVEVGKVINDVKSSFSEVANILKEMDEEVFKKNKKLLESGCVSRLLNLTFNATTEILLEAQKKVIEESKLSKEFIQNIEVRASNFLDNLMKKHKIIPQDGSIQIEHIGEGTLGDGFWVNFLDKDGGKLFHGKVLKVYKNIDYKNEILFDSSMETLKYYKKMPKEDYIQKVTSVIEKTDIDEEQKILAKNNLEATYLALQNTTEENIKDSLKMAEDMNATIHGVKAESNAASFIQKAIGHKLNKSDLIKTYFFDLKNGFSLSEMSDDTLGKVTKKTDFSKLGLASLDTDSTNPLANAEANVIAGRIVDYGAIVIIDPSLHNSKEARRACKKTKCHTAT